MLLHSFYILPFVVAALYCSHHYVYKYNSKEIWKRDPVSKMFRYMAVADDAGICSSIGTDIMVRQNGSTVDAAIATEICVTVANPQSTGISSDLFMTIYDTPRGKTEKELMTIIARSAAPLAATRDMFVNSNPLEGGRAIAVPGIIKGLHAAWERYGRVEWKNLVQPTVDILREGIPTHRVMVLSFDLFGYRILKNDNLRATFTKPDGSWYKLNEKIKIPKLLKTYEQIAENPLALYEKGSPLLADFIADIKDYGGIITEEDMEVFEPRFVKPIHATLKNSGYTIYAPTAPGGGPTLLHLLKILDGYNFTADSISTTEKQILTYHRFLEASKFAYAKRSGLGDLKFTKAGDSYQQELIEKMLSSDFSDSRRMMINDEKTHDVTFYEPEYQIKHDHGTSHISLLGRDGSAVSLTSSINLYYGSGLQGSRTGIIFGNQMGDFSTPGKADYFGIPPAPANFIEPGKMPLSTTAPFIMFDSDGIVRFVGGSSGGSAIATANAFIIANVLWFKKTLDAATGIFRIHHQLVPNQVCMESEYEWRQSGNQKMTAGLKAKGNKIAYNCQFSVTQNIINNCDMSDKIRREPCIQAVSDGRKVGIPDGV